MTDSEGPGAGRENHVRGDSVTTDGTPIPIAYSALEKGTPVLSASGREFGGVEHVLEIPSEDLFDGIVVATDAGLRFVDRDQIDQITTTHVQCGLTDEQVAGLSEPNAAPVLMSTHRQTSARRCMIASDACSAARTGRARPRPLPAVSTLASRR